MKNNTEVKRIIETLSDNELLDLESRLSFNFFWEMANSDLSSPGYGLCRDRYPDNTEIASIASVGFALSALVVGVERNWITWQEGYSRALGTINTMLRLQIPEMGYFTYHFVDIKTGKRWTDCEVSIIDSAIVVNGALCAGEYFGGDIKLKAKELYENIDWSWYADREKRQFYMGYDPVRGFSGHWDVYAEQLMLYTLAASAPTKPVDDEIDLYNNFIRSKSSYRELPPFIHSWFGSLFTHQLSFIWDDYRNKIDKNGIDWWENSITATKSNIAYCVDMHKDFKTYGINSWGLTACDGPNGYNGSYGAVPNGSNSKQNTSDGTVPPSGVAGSIVFTPKEAIDSLRNFYENYDGKIFGKYGFIDGFNLDCTESGWFASSFIGINKGITLLMIENYRTGLIWKLMNQNKYIQDGFEKLGITNKNI